MKNNLGITNLLKVFLNTFLVALIFNCTVASATGAFTSDKHRNLFAEMNIASSSAVKQKLQAAYQQLFFGNPNDQSIMYAVGSDRAFIKSIDSNDIRSEGMSYGMMISIMMNDKSTFNKLWKFSKTEMQHLSGDRKYYFSWQLETTAPFNPIDPNPAPDGEAYFAMALMFAANRWGNGSGIFNYSKEANLILDEIVNKRPNNTVGPLFNPTNKQIVFTPDVRSEQYTDPSYHLPGFYELWALWADKNQAFWRSAARVSRDFFQTAAHPTTGLYTDYANFDGSPKFTTFNPNSHLSAFDAMRTIQNVAFDYAWFKKDNRAVGLANRILNFYNSKGNYVSVYTHNGVPQVPYRTEGHVAMNAVAALAASSPNKTRFVQDLWNVNVPTGEFRYYSGMLYMLGLLHVSGEFKIYKPGENTKPVIVGPLLTLLLSDDAPAPSSEPVDPNLIENSGFEENDSGWFAFGNASIEVTTTQAFAGTQSLLASSRTQVFEGPAIDLFSVVQPGGRYSLSARVRTSDNGFEEVRATVQSTCSGGDQFNTAAGVDANNTAWQELSGTITIPNCGATAHRLYFEGPSSGVDIYLDEVSVVVAPALSNLISNSDFESGTSGWFRFGSPTISTTTSQAFSGSQSLQTTGRTQNFEGPAIDLVGVLQPGSTYSLSARVRVSTSAETVQATLQVVCPGGDQFPTIGSVSAVNTGWATLSGSITVPNCPASALRLYFQGPGSGVDIFIDQVFMTESF